MDEKAVLAQQILGLLDQYAASNSLEHAYIVLYDEEFLNACQQLHFNITPSNFYSNVPIIDETDEFSTNTLDAEIYSNEAIFDEAKLAAFLTEISCFNDELLRLEKICATELDVFRTNSQFTYSDPSAYYSIIRHCKPANIVEIGSGFSTQIACEAVLKNEGDCQIHCFEPYPSEALASLGNINLTEKKAQDITVCELNELLTDGDILFVDSTHVVKEGSDVIHIILNLLPNLDKRVYVHFHDIFLPFGFPSSFLKKMLFWEEQYLLYAFLLDNPKVNVLFGTAYNTKHFPSEMQNFTIRDIGGGSSFWFEYNPA